ncbi:TlpA family protein disulfide reductase [Actinotalea sp. M2MS4P-6]|uniref:TlpA family protein disulfide reductase n=1 Tax=Actinotalea sp. M2MS4P-6 TaxID=2983762 RepID=UPI0021E3C769|nr:TlpA disulfide reductase family protein [Actinotalea sp. M2MS4P-6]MCV2394872.1 TlpA family protein disulfide reductase [Actinotalea sp. M2MS4P-6]
MRRMHGVLRPLMFVLAVAVAAAMVIALASCSGSPLYDETGSAGDSGTTTVDRSVTTWQPDERPGPIELTAETFAGDEVDLAAWRGDVVLVNTWFANCPPCRAEAPDLAEIVGEYQAEGLQAVGINVSDDAGTAQAFERTFALPYGSIPGSDGKAVAAMQGTVPLQAVPTTVLLDRQGRVAARILGMADPSTLRSLIDDLMAEQA